MSPTSLHGNTTVQTMSTAITCVKQLLVADLSNAKKVETKSMWLVQVAIPGRATADIDYRWKRCQDAGLCNA